MNCAEYLNYEKLLKPGHRIMSTDPGKPALQNGGIAPHGVRRILMQPVQGGHRAFFSQNISRTRFLQLYLLSSLWLLTLIPSLAIVDSNDNGLSDLWEKQYNTGNLFPSTFDPSADPDGDGWTNAREAAAGTDPFNANPPDGMLRPAIVHTPAVWYDPDVDGIPDLLTPEVATITWETLPGKLYSLFFSTDLSAGGWIPLDEPRLADGLSMGLSVTLSQPDGSSPERLFWRVSVEDTDSDGDLLTDYEEFVLGTDPQNRDTDGDGLTDHQEVLLGTNPTNTDTDGDGLPDDWELANGLDPNDNGTIDPSNGFAGDADEDGVSNGQEFLGGTNPVNPVDYPDQVIIVKKSFEAGSNVPKENGVISAQSRSLSWNRIHSPYSFFQTEIDPAYLVAGLESTSFPNLGQALGEPEYLQRTTWDWISNVSGHANYRATSSDIADSRIGHQSASRGWLHVPTRSLARTVHFLRVKERTKSRSGFFEREVLESEVFPVTVPALSQYSSSFDMGEMNPSEFEQGYTIIVSEYLKWVRISPDQGMSGVVGDKIKSSAMASDVMHFVTPRKTSEIPDNYVVLKADGIEPEYITPGHASQLFEWEGGEEVPGAPLKRRVKRDATGVEEVKIKAKESGMVISEMHVWVVWCDITVTRGTVSFSSYPGNIGVKYAVDAYAPWKFVFTIQPHSIVDPSVTERPDLTGEASKSTPGKGKPYSFNPIRGTGDHAERKWDVSRQYEVMIKNPAQVSLRDEKPAVWYLGQPKTEDKPILFPDSDVEGNDDPLSQEDENSNPYVSVIGPLAHEIGQLSSVDAPSLSVHTSIGAPGAFFAKELRFKEFARVELWDGKRSNGIFWFRVSDHRAWHHYLRVTFNGTTSLWEDSGSSSAEGN